MYHTLIQDVNSVNTESGLDTTGEIATNLQLSSTLIQAENGKSKYRLHYKDLISESEL